MLITVAWLFITQPILLLCQFFSILLYFKQLNFISCFSAFQTIMEKWATAAGIRQINALNFTGFSAGFSIIFVEKLDRAFPLICDEKRL